MMVANQAVWEALSKRAVEHLRELLKLDTTNPPGNEHLVADYVATELRRMKLEPKVVHKAVGRDNVVARIKGDGSGKPVLLASHADVVLADEAEWTHPPFAAVEAEGCLWGRGALDMKCGTAMHLATLEALVEAETSLRRDVIMAVVADEEAGLEKGSRFLVDEHPDLVRAEYALGEFGGFNIQVMGRKVIPIQVAEKGLCWLRATARGTPGHGSMPERDNAVVKLAQAIATIGRKRLPVHLSDVTRAYLKGLASALPPVGKTLMTLLQDERTAGLVLDLLGRMPEIRKPLVAALTNTASPTMLSAGEKINVIPDRAEAMIDGRTLPGQGPGDIVRELKSIAPLIDFEVVSAQASAQASHETELYTIMASALERHHPDGTVVPMLLPGMTDAKAWSRLGAQCYGFIPLVLPDDFPPVFELIHGHDERLPVAAIEQGVKIFLEVILAFCSAKDG